MYRSITIMDTNHVQKSINTSSGQVRHIIRQWKHLLMERLSRCEQKLLSIYVDSIPNRENIGGGRLVAPIVPFRGYVTKKVRNRLLGSRCGSADLFVSGDLHPGRPKSNDRYYQCHTLWPFLLIFASLGPLVLKILLSLKD